LPFAGRRDSRLETGDSGKKKKRDILKEQNGEKIETIIEKSPLGIKLLPIKKNIKDIIIDVLTSPVNTNRLT